MLAKLRQSQPGARCTVFINMAMAEVVSHHGRKLDLGNSKRAVVQRHANEGIEKSFLDDDLRCRGRTGTHDRWDEEVIAPECGLLHRTAHERPRGVPCLLCFMSARS